MRDLYGQSNSAVLNILMCNFLFQVTSSFVIDSTLRQRAPVYGFSIDIKLLTLKLIERYKAICYE